MDGMDQAAITDYISSALPGVDVHVAAEGDGSPEIARGDSFFFYDPDRILKGANQFPFATIVTKDYGDFDNASNLNREGVFSTETYSSLFPADDASLDFTRLDVLMPHPVYAVNHWVCVLNPSVRTFESVKPLLAEAHARAARRYEAISRSGI